LELASLQVRSLLSLAEVNIFSDYV
jgi:hypothetical protein